MSTPDDQSPVSELEEDSPELEEDPWQDAADVGTDVARAAWADEARIVLIDAAGRYGSTITHKEVSALVQEGSMIRTKQPTHYWIGDVLGRVARDCASRDEPLLSSLCVNAQGSVGDDYATVAAEISGEAVADGDDHAAHERLACYKFFDATIPSHGGRAQLTDRLSAARTRTRKAAKEARPANVCPNCNMALPATGDCDNCA
jgi:hypothetical protein